DLEVQVRAEAVTRAADVADYVALPDLLAARRCDRALVGVRGREAVAVVDHDEVAVALLPAAVDDRARGRGADRRAVRDADVDPLVHPAPAPAERTRDGAVDGPDQPARGGRPRRGAAGRLP